MTHTRTFQPAGERCSLGLLGRRRHHLPGARRNRAGLRGAGGPDRRVHARLLGRPSACFVLAYRATSRGQELCGPRPLATAHARHGAGCRAGRRRPGGGLLSSWTAASPLHEVLVNARAPAVARSSGSGLTPLALGRLVMGAGLGAGAALLRAHAGAFPRTADRRAPVGAAGQPDGAVHARARSPARARHDRPLLLRRRAASPSAAPRSSLPSPWPSGWWRVPG